MSRALVIALAIAACTSPKPTPTPPASTVKDLLALLDADAARACACTARACTEAVEADLAPPLEAVRVPARWIEDKPAREHALAAIWRATRCMQAHDTVAYGFAPIATRYATAAREIACVCRTADCVRTVRATVGLTDLYATAVPLDADADKQVSEERDVATRCERAIVHPGLDGALDDLGALRDRACACEDTACADQVRQDATAWANRNADVKGGPEDTAKVKSIATELQDCLGAIVR